MIVLGFDTSAAHCAAALLRADDIIASRRDAMSRGQAEHLMVMIHDMLDEAGLNWRDLDVIGTGIGPGNFTGIRISVSAARGLALGLGVDAIGISRFDVIRHALLPTADTRGVAPSASLACVAAPQDRVYVQAEGSAPQLMPRAQAEAMGHPMIFEPDDFNPAPAIAQLAQVRAGQPQQRPAPLYIKSADAAPAKDTAPRLVP